MLVAATGASITAWWQARREAAAPRKVTRLSIPLPPGQVMSGTGGMALTRDGRAIAYAARDASGTARLYLRELDRFETRAVQESEGAQQPFFSPDGSRVGFFARGKLMTAAVAGGAPAPIADCSAQPIGGTWGEDGTIVFAPALAAGLLRVSASGGTPKQLTQPDEGPHGYAHGRPGFLPGGRSLVYTIWGTPSGDVRGSALLSLDSGTSTRLTASMWSSRYASSGHLLLSGPRGIRAAAFDPAHPGLVNPETFVIDEVYSTAAWSDSWFAVSDTGTLAYVPGDATLGRLTWLDRDGRPSPLSDPLSLIDPNLSPDGSRIAFQDRDDNIWVLDVHRASRTRLTLDGEGSNAYALWTHDGSRVVFASNRSGDWDIYSVAATGGPATRLLARPGNQFPTSLAPDGSILFSERAKGTAASTQRLSPEGSVSPLLRSTFSTVGAQLSPDGRSLAYVSDENGQDEVYLRAYGQPGEAVPVSTSGGGALRWSPDGRQLFYRRGDAFMAAGVSWAGGRIVVADPREMFTVQASRGRSTIVPGYSVAADGRFLVFLSDPKAIPNRIDVVLNWFEELRAKVPAR